MRKRMRILLVDTSSVLHIVKHSGKKQLKEKDLPTYILYGFLLKLQLFMRKTKSDVCVFANDGPSKESLRAKLYPTYKEKRNDKTKKTEEEIAFDNMAYNQFNQVKDDILPMLGYSNIFATKGLEADDIIGKICKTYTHCEIFVVSTDEDMYQLLSEKVCVLNPKTTQYFSMKNFVDKYGILPHFWKRVKAIGGCTSDEVKGIQGVAEKTVLKYLKGELPIHYKSYQAIISPEGRKITNRNKALVILPFRRTPDYKVEEDKISKIKIQGMAKKYNFKAIEMDLETWFSALKGWK